MKRNLERILWGLVFISIGGLLLANVLNLINIEAGQFIWKLWPVFLLIPGISSIFKGRIFWGLVLLVAGSTFMLSNFTDINAWKYVFPVLIISVGISFFFKPKQWNHFTKKEETDDKSIDEVAVFGGVEKKVKTDEFMGGKIDSIFGGSQIDLREVKLGKDKVYLDINVIFGGSEIFVNPQNYKIVSKGTGLFGAWTNKSEHSKKDSPTLIIKGGAIFGGVEIKS